MNGSKWRIDDPEPYPTPPGIVHGSWVSLHYLRAALQRHWWVIVALATAGIALALATLFLVPRSASASSTVLLTHGPTDDPATAIQIDQSLLGTRTVSESVVSQLGLSITPDEFRASFTSSQLSTELIEIELQAPTNKEAVARLNALATTFLQFRNTQLRAQTEHAIQANDEQVSRLQTSVSQLTRQYNSALEDGNGQLASDTLNRKSQLLAQIAALQSENQAAEVRVDSVTSASHVIDAASVVPVSGLKRLVLGTLSGLILGAGLGIAGVFGHTLVSNKLRRREDIATALNRPVAFSAGKARGRLPWKASARRHQIDVLAKGLTTTLTPIGRADREALALLGVGDMPSAARVLCAAAQHLESLGNRVFLVDLTIGGWLMKEGCGPADLPVYRPQEHVGPVRGQLRVASSADTGPAHDDPLHEGWMSAEVVLVLGEVELGIGSGHLSLWADRCVLLVAAGKTTAELLRSIARTLMRGGPTFEFAMLVGADKTDQSVGLPRRVEVDEPQRRVR
jgi:capsular polysaccharide biosynthesis protein